MKKIFASIVLTGLMLTGCSGKQAEEQPTAAAKAVAVEEVAVPGVLGLTLDKAEEQLEDLGFDVEAVDIVDGKSIIVESNWQVMSQDPAEGASLAKGSTVNLGVKSLEKIAAEKAAADKAAADKAAAAKAAADKAAAAKKAAADKVAADKAAATLAAQKAADQKVAAQKAADAAAAQQAAQQAAPKPAPVVQAPPAVYYANCTAARAAGAAPVYSGSPGYGTHLDRDRDGIGCDK